MGVVSDGKHFGTFATPFALVRDVPSETHRLDFRSL